MLPRTGPPHLSASSPTDSEVLRLDFEPNTTILSPGPLSYQPDDGSSSPFALAGSPRPETTSMSPEGSLASKTTKYVSSGGNHYHLALLSPNRTPAEPWAHSEWRNEATTALGHTKNEGAGNQFGVWKGKDRLASETPHIVAWDHVATEAPAHSMNKPTHQSVASGSTKPYTPDEETQVPPGLLARQRPAPEESDIEPGEHDEDAMVEVQMAIIWHVEQITNQTRHTRIIAKAQGLVA